jgi:integrase/recombinase XerD
MEASTDANFKQNYQSHVKHLKLKGIEPKTIEAYSRAIRQVGEHFDHQIDNLSAQQVTNYFSDLVTSHSWSSVKLDLYGLKFYYAHAWYTTDLRRALKSLYVSRFSWWRVRGRQCVPAKTAP